MCPEGAARGRGMTPRHPATEHPYGPSQKHPHGPKGAVRDDRPGTAGAGPGNVRAGARRSGIHLPRSRAGADRRRTSRGQASRPDRGRPFGGGRRCVGPQHVPQRRTALPGAAVRQRGTSAAVRGDGHRERPRPRTVLPGTRRREPRPGTALTDRGTARDRHGVREAGRRTGLRGVGGTECGQQPAGEGRGARHPGLHQPPGISAPGARRDRRLLGLAAAGRYGPGRDGDRRGGPGSSATRTWPGSSLASSSAPR